MIYSTNSRWRRRGSKPARRCHDCTRAGPQTTGLTKSAKTCSKQTGTLSSEKCRAHLKRCECLLNVKNPRSCTETDGIRPSRVPFDGLSMHGECFTVGNNHGSTF